MPNKVRWGVLSTSQFALRLAVPAMQKSEWCDIRAIASREQAKAEKAALALGIPKTYASYEELLRDPDIEAIYNPLPNHMHVPWSIKAAEAGKHVLCEKPLGVSVREANELQRVQERTGVKIGEAFMVRTNPQWLRARELVRSGRIGQLRSIVGHFSYFNRDANNIRNKYQIGGGGLMDIGCYPITTSRFIYDEEPKRVVSLLERDPDMEVDRLASVILDFPSGQAIFTCGTQLVPYQRMNLLGTKGRIEIEIPFNAPNERPCRIFVDDGGDLTGKTISTETFPVCDQYTIQGDLFSRAIREDLEVPVPVTDAIKNMAVIEAAFRSAQSGNWEKP
ncbi:MAG TPA: Gfo/Idh/MocA family oxidoreductase [Terriglobales bacterium]|jgi:predicted dehydrogenase|nr:Gfo/Idh/MocA family oxidoreductase [Terriglobales bacterium]